MPKEAEKLKVSNSSGEVVCDLYTDTGDVGTKYLAVRVGSNTRFAKLASPTHPDASKLQVYKGATYAALKYAFGYSKWVVGGSGSADGQFSVPTSGSIDPEGNILIADRNNYRIQKLDTNGNWIWSFGSIGDGDSQFRSPVYISVSTDGSFFVYDGNTYKLKKFSSDTTFLWTKPGYNLWGGIAATTDGGVVASTGTTIIKVDSTGTSTQTITAAGGTNFSQIKNPTVASDGIIWCADTQNNRIVSIDFNTEIATAFGTAGTGNGQLSYPQSVAFDSSGNIYVAESGTDRVQKFTSAFEHIFSVGSYSGTAVDGKFYDPKSICVLPNGYFAVNESNFGRAQLFSCADGSWRCSSPNSTSNVFVGAAAGNTLITTDGSSKIRKLDFNV